MTRRDFYLDPELVPLSTGRPLLILDADEVLLRFADGFDRFLRSRGLYLDFVSYRLHGNVKRIADDCAVLDVEVTALLEEFRMDLDSLEPVADAVETVAGLRPHLDALVLSNVTPSQAPARRRNLDTLGLCLPLLANSGSKGRAVHAMCKRAGRPVFFMDDIAQHHAACAELAPEVLRIHFVGDERLRPLMPPSPHANFRAQTWRDADNFIRSHLSN